MVHEEIYSILALSAKKGYIIKNKCEIILDVGQWFRSRCCLEIILFLTLRANLFTRVEPIFLFLALVSDNEWNSRGQHGEHLCV